MRGQRCRGAFSVGLMFMLPDRAFVSLRKVGKLNDAYVLPKTTWNASGLLRICPSLGWSQEMVRGKRGKSQAYLLPQERGDT